jgi:NTP pyrophosphatase (non-canonical NTP hydrolase)
MLMGGGTFDQAVRYVLSFDEYQQKAFSLARYPEKGTGSYAAIAYTGLGLGEAGEVQGKIKKIARDCNGQLTTEMRDAIIKEAGDVLWYLGALATELGTTLEEMAEKNLINLFGRLERGTIHGSGDNR